MLLYFCITLLNVYQKYFRPFLPRACRFVPSCSEYAKEAIQKYGVARGLLKSIIRISRCQPYCRKSGYDPA